MAMFCNRCGTAIRPGKGFCMNCGAPIAAAPAEPHRRGRKAVVWTIAATAIIVVMVVCIVLAFSSSTGKNGGGVKGDDAGPATGEFVTGPRVELASAVVPAAGGALRVDKPGDPLDGLTVEVPEGTYDGDRAFKVYSSEIKSNTFEPELKPATPMIYIDDGGGEGAGPVTLEVPLDLAGGEFATCFLYDEGNGWLEGTYTMGREEGSHTAAFTLPDRPQFFLKGNAAEWQAKVKNEGVSSSYQPKVDDWEFPNEGSALHPGGQSAAQSRSELWYWCAKKHGGGAKPLYDLYDNNGKEPKTPDLWQDDSNGYRFVSMVQDYWTTGVWGSRSFARAAMGYNLENNLLQSKNSVPLMASMMWHTRMPVSLILFDVQWTEATALNVLAWKIEGDRVYVTDPNFPGDASRYITCTSDGTLSLYESGPIATVTSSGGSVTYVNAIPFIPFSDSEKVAMDSQWYLFEQGVVGLERFPAYSLKASRRDVEGSTTLNPDTTFVSDREEIRIDAVLEETGGKWSRLITRVYRDGGWLKEDDAGYFMLKEGLNQLGVFICAEVSGTAGYVDFKWVKVEYKKDDGGLKTEKLYHDNGKLAHEFTYYLKDGAKVMHGYDHIYRENGSLMMKYHWVDGKKEGLQEWYYASGQVQEQQEMKNDLWDGYLKKYDEKGKLTYEAQYRNGELVPGSEKYYQE